MQNRSDTLIPLGQRLAIVFATGILATGLAVARAQEPPNDAPGLPFTISEDTTYVTEPRTHDGLIDYAAVLNQRLSEGVTSETNAAVLFYRALGPRPENVVLEDKFFELLGMARPAEEGKYLLPFGAYLQQEWGIEPRTQPDQQDLELQTLAMRQPWQAEDYPQVAAWLEFNKEPLALFVQGTQRPEYYLPLVLSDEVDPSAQTLIHVLLPGVQMSREAARALVARTLLRAGEGRMDAAWSDVLATYRLGELTSRGPTLVEALVGIAIESMAVNAAVELVAHAQPDAMQARQWLRDLDRLPTGPDMEAKVDLAERFMSLDVTQHLATGRIATDDLLLGGGPDRGEAILEQIARSATDWDVVMKMCNQWYDRMVAAMSLEDPQERQRALQKISQDLKQLAAQTQDLGGFLGRLAFSGNPRRVVGEMMGTILISLMLPAVEAVQGAEDRIVQMRQNLRLALALAAYRSDKDHYPAGLDALSPDYLAEVPKDIFGGKPLRYRRNASGFLLYSVGQNREDDGGQSFADEPKGDDLRIRMP